MRSIVTFLSSLLVFLSTTLYSTSAISAPPETNKPIPEEFRSPYYHQKMVESAQEAEDFYNNILARAEFASTLSDTAWGISLFLIYSSMRMKTKNFNIKNITDLKKIYKLSIKKESPVLMLERVTVSSGINATLKQKVEKGFEFFNISTFKSELADVEFKIDQLKITTTDWNILNTAEKALNKARKEIDLSDHWFKDGILRGEYDVSRQRALLLIAKKTTLIREQKKIFALLRFKEMNLQNAGHTEGWKPKKERPYNPCRLLLVGQW